MKTDGPVEFQLNTRSQSGGRQILTASAERNICLQLSFATPFITRWTLIGCPVPEVEPTVNVHGSHRRKWPKPQRIHYFRSIRQVAAPSICLRQTAVGGRHRFVSSCRAMPSSIWRQYNRTVTYICTSMVIRDWFNSTQSAADCVVSWQLLPANGESDCRFVCVCVCVCSHTWNICCRQLDN